MHQPASDVVALSRCNWFETACGFIPTRSAKSVTHTVNDGTSVTCAEYSGGASGAEVILYTIHGGGQTWPGGKRGNIYRGRTTHNISANDLMWEFFQRHPRRRARDGGRTRETQGERG